MANHSSTKKSIRKTVRKTAVNKTRKASIRTYVKKVLEAVKANDTTLAASSFVKAQSELARGVSHSILKKNTASRITKRLAEKLRTIDFNGKLPELTTRSKSASEKTVTKTKKPAIEPKDKKSPPKAEAVKPATKTAAKSKAATPTTQGLSKDK